MKFLPIYLANKIKNSKEAFSAIIINIGIISVALAVCTLILSFFVLNGFKKTIENKIFAQTSHLQINKITLNRSFEEATMPNNLDLEKNIKQNPAIQSISKIGLKSIILKSKDHIEGVILKGVDKNYDWSIFQENIIQGRKPAQDSTKNEIMISNKLAQNLNVKLNESILIYFIQSPPRARNAKIVGIYDSNIEEFDEVYIMGELSLIQSINKWEQGEFGHYEILVKDLSRLDNLKKELLTFIPQSYEVKKVNELMPQFYDWFNMLDRNILLVIVLIIIVVSFNVCSVLIIMIMERTPMVGLLKAIGTADGQIMKIFLFNLSKILIKGLVAGNIIALLLAFIQWKFKILKLDAQNYYMHYIPVHWDVLTIILVNVGVFLMILLVGLLPSLIIKRIKILDAIKYKD